MAGIQFSASLTGADAALRKFADLERKTSAKIVKKATRAGLAPQLRAAKSSQKYVNRTGNLRRRLGVSVRSRKAGTVTIGKVLARKGARYAVPLEYGHRVAIGRSGASEKGTVLRRKDGRLKRVDQRYGVSAGRVAPREFMRDAFTRSTSRAQSDFTASFVRQVNEVANG